MLLTDFSKPTSVDLDILSNIQRNLGLQYYLLPIGASENYDVFCDNLERLLSFGAAGLIVTPPIRSHESAEQLARAQHLLSQRQAVFINRLVEGVEGDLFTMDLYSGMLKALEYFAMREKRRVAVVLHNTRKFADEQLAAWREGCQRFGMEADERLIIPWNDDFVVARDQLAELIPLYDALIGSDMVLYTMQDVLIKSRLRVPADLSIVGINDSLHTRMFQPQMTGLAYPAERICHSAVQRLIHRIEKGGDGAFVRKDYIPSLIIRGT